MPSTRMGPMRVCYRNSILLNLVLLLVAAGCSNKPTPDDGHIEKAPPTPLASQPSDATAEVSKTRSEVVPGTDVARLSDDPANDGWQSEALATDIAGQLKHLVHLLPGSAESAEHTLAQLATASAEVDVIAANDLEVAFEQQNIVVRRLTTTERTSGTIADGTASLVGDLTPSDVHAKVKVIRVDVSNQQTPKSTAYVQIWGRCADGRFQVNSNWETVWELTASGLHLQQLRIRDYERVVVAQNAPVFSDCTEAVLSSSGSGDVFQKQLLPGIDHWLGNIESRMGIDIGGWQGLSVVDVNGDLLDDLYICQPGGLPNRLFVQQPDGTCRETSAEAGLDWVDSSHAALFVDLDNDGDQDAVVGLKDGILLMSNDGSGVFEKRASKILPAALPYSLSAADYDNDGDLDIYICCYNRRSGVNQHLLFARPVPYHDANNGGRNVLLRNDIVSTDDASVGADAANGGVVPADGPWRFRYVTKQVGLDTNNRRFTYASAWEDYDNDGDLDLYVANDFGRNNLYENEAGQFTEVTETARVEDISPGMSTCWGDYNNDGLMDLYVSNMFSSAGNRITHQGKFLASATEGTRAAFQRHARGNSLFQNVGDRNFQDVSEQANVALGRWAWGSRFADINNDGWQDLLVANGFITQADTGDL